MSSQSPRPQLILASSSPYRRELLARFRIPFTCRPPSVVETPRPGEAAMELTRRLAAAKARDVATRFPGSLVIGSDQLAELEGQLMGKPGSEEQAVGQLMRCSGRQLTFLTAVAVVRKDPVFFQEFLVPTTVEYRPFSEDEARRYVALDRPLDCAGAVKSEAAGPMLLNRVESSDPTALIGLPLIRLAAVLRLAGLELP